MDAIGGYFELADYEEGKGFPHPEGILLNTGRNALEFILRSIGNVRRVYLPYYTCEVVLEPLKKLSIPWTYYRINLNLEMDELVDLGQDEYLIVNNYFGIKDYYIERIASVYGERLIVDCAQAFFAKPIPGIKSFYSCRKFVGVADGGIAYSGLPFNENDYPEDDSSTHDSHLYIRKQYGAEAGFREYQENEHKLDCQPIRLMSSVTRSALKHIDYKRVVLSRVSNFQFLHRCLANDNQLSLPDVSSFNCPMVYPFMIAGGDSMRKTLIDNKVYVARYWPDNKGISFELEDMLTKHFLPLPIDHRYGKSEMQIIVDIIKS